MEKSSSDHLKSEDVQTINETFDLIKNLSKELEDMGKVKKKIETDISHLNERVEQQEKPPLDKKELVQKEEAQALPPAFPQMKDQIINSLKQELLKELTPLFKRFDVKNLQQNISEEINAILEEEGSKLRSEFDHKNQDSRKEFTRKLSELETRLKDSLQNSDRLKSSLSGVKQGEVKSIYNELEKKVHEGIGKNNEKFFKLFSSSIEEMDTLKGVVKGYGKELEAAFDELLKLDRENQKLKETIIQIEKTQDKEIVQKVNEVVDQLNKQDDNYQKTIKEIKKEIHREVSDSLGEKKKELLEEHKRIEKDHNEKFTQLDEYFESLRKQIAQHEKSFESRGKEELQGLEKRFKETLDSADKKIEELKEMNESQEEYIVSKINELIENVNLFEEKKDSELNTIRNALKEEFTEAFGLEIKKAKESFEEQLAKELVKLNEAKTKHEIETKEFRTKLSESIDEKLLNSQKQHDTEFKELLKDVDTSVKEKEKEYVDKLLAVDQEKKATLKELESLKDEVSKEVESELNRLDKIIEKTEAKLENFNELKEKNLEEFSDEIEIKKQEFSEFANKLAETKEQNENSLRETLSKKINNLQEHVDSRLDSLDKKFLEKQHKLFEDKIKEELKTIEVLREQLESRAGEIDNKMHLIEGKVDAFFANLSNEGKDLNHKVESRVTHLEKQLNKRFLDYDSDFSNFKSIVIDEVEDLMREINGVLQNKTEVLDSEIQRLGMEKSEAASRTQMASSMQGVIEKELQDMREEMSELRMKTQQNTGSQSLNGTVNTMLQYENSLISLIRSLKERGVEREAIKDLLINKGHPRVYVTVLLDNYETLLKH
jgi:DNA repair exonuclease SbcCD ATPase subunit